MKCTIIGKFAFGNNILDGQTVKCSTIFDYFKEKYGAEKIETIDTYKWEKNPIKLFIKCYKAVKYSDNIIIMPAHNGIKVFAPLLNFFNKFYKKKLFYIVIGSWLFSKVEDKGLLFKTLIKYDGIFVETTNLKNNLENLGFKNVYKMNNVKNIKPVTKIEKYKVKQILKICTFSRINYNKGITDIIEVINKINDSEHRFDLDIYGQIENDYEQEFNTLLNGINYVKYKGKVKPDLSTNVIKKYDLLVFPTRYFTEGIPGTIIDAFSAAVPVLCSRWDNVNDIVIDNYNGYIFDFESKNDMESKLINIYGNQDKLYDKKENCLESFNHFSSINELNIIFDMMD